MEAAFPVEAVKFASTVPESARLGLSSMLRTIMVKRNGQSHIVFLSKSFSKNDNPIPLSFLLPTARRYS